MTQNSTNCKKAQKGVRYEKKKKLAYEIALDIRSKLKEKDCSADYRDFQEEDNGYFFDVRYWGEWENPEDAEDEEDYDWQVLTDFWRSKLKVIREEIAKKYKSLKFSIYISEGEKNYIDCSVFIK